MEKTEQLHLRLEPKLKEKLKEHARKDGRTLSNYVLYVLKKEINNIGDDGYEK